MDHIDPFLLLDEMGPAEYEPDAGHTALVHVFDGSVTVNDRIIDEGNMVVFGRIAGVVHR